MSLTAILIIVFFNTIITFIIYDLMGRDNIFFNQTWKRILALIPPLTLSAMCGVAIFGMIKSLLQFLGSYFRE